MSRPAVANTDKRDAEKSVRKKPFFMPENGI